MGGPIIVQMLAKYGVDKGVSFFSGYGEATGQMWGKFVAVMNATAQNAGIEYANGPQARKIFFFQIDAPSQTIAFGSPANKTFVRPHSTASVSVSTVTR